MGLDRNRCLPPESDMLSTLAFPPDSSIPTDESAFDASTHDGLRHALEGGWPGRLGQRGGRRDRRSAAAARRLVGVPR